MRTADDISRLSIIRNVVVNRTYPLLTCFPIPLSANTRDHCSAQVTSHFKNVSPVNTSATSVVYSCSQLQSICVHRSCSHSLFFSENTPGKDVRYRQHRVRKGTAAHNHRAHRMSRFRELRACTLHRKVLLNFHPADSWSHKDGCLIAAQKHLRHSELGLGLRPGLSEKKNEGSSTSASFVSKRTRQVKYNGIKTVIQLH